MNKSVIGAVLLVVAIAVIGFVAFGGDDDTETTTATTTTTTTSQPTSNTADEAEVTSNAEEPQASETAELTAAEVANHATESDCWTIISGNVYDITSYIPRHPGGDDILLACGTDGTSLFTSRTTADGETVGSGTAHSSGASSQLEGFLLGALAN